MQFRLRTLLIVLAALPLLLAAAWFAAQFDWPDEALLLVAIACAVPYWTGLVIVLAKNLRSFGAWGIAITLAILWPFFFFMSILQLAVAIPIWTVLLVNGSDLKRPPSLKSICIATGLTVAFFAWIACVALMHP